MRAKSQTRSQNVPIAAELCSRKKFYRKIQQIRRRAAPGRRFAPLERALREDRNR